MLPDQSGSPIAQFEGESASGGQSVPKSLRGTQSSCSTISRSGGGLALSTCPMCRLLDSHFFRVLLLRGLQLPLACLSCGRSLGAHGHHRAACARTGVLGRRGHAAECVAARICREVGRWVATNTFRDLGLDLQRRRRPGGGWALAVDTTLVSALRGDGSARTGAARRDGVALAAARRAKERRTNWCGARARSCAGCGSGEGGGRGGRWSPETQKFLSLLARARTRAEGWLLIAS